MNISQSIKQNLEIKLTPKMQASLNLLQMSSLEYIDFVNESSINNVLLEVESPDFKIDFKRYESKESNKYVSVNYESMFHKNISEQQFIEQWVYEQVDMNLYTVNEKDIFHYLVQNLNSDGYLELSLDEAASKYNLPYHIAEKMLKLLQGLEPVGIGSRSLSECLLLQIEHLKGKNNIAYLILEYYSQSLASNDYKRIAEQLDCTVKEVQQAIAFLKTLEVRPLSYLVPSEPQYVIPDITIEKYKGNFIVNINKSHLPKVSISEDYINFKYSSDPKLSDFLTPYYQEAILLLQSIEQRELTLYKLGLSFIELQSDFLEFGITALKPMRMKDLALKLHLHESTISRAVRQKYIQTPVGFFELSNLFVNGIETNDGKVFSTNTIKDYIKQLILHEEKHKPLSDQKISDLLMQQGISISRRTVTKYRDSLGILSSTQRVQYI